MRNLCYDIGIFSSTEYRFPTICVGNLSVGGTGKTPHTEYIVSILRDKYKLATLSRGYGRKSKGFRLASDTDSPTTIGDEAFQIFSKFQDITVAVDEKRRRGIRKLRAQESCPEVIVLDDAFQHRSVKAGLSILLTDYSKMYIDDFMLPSGTLREGKIGARRADIIVITKSPAVLSPIDIRRIASDLKPQEYQKVFFSYIAYKKLKPLNESAEMLTNQKKKLADRGVLLVSAIANSEPLKLHLKRYAKEIEEIAFKDHHFFNEGDYKKISKKLDQLLSLKKAIVVTEKDQAKFDASFFKDIPVFCIPMSIKFHKNQSESFTESIKNYVRSY